MQLASKMSILMHNSLNSAYVCSYVWGLNIDVRNLGVKSLLCAHDPTLNTALND